MKNAAVASLGATSKSSRGFMKKTDIHPYMRTLRLQLFDMSRVSQRSVDYSIKAYTLFFVENAETVFGRATRGRCFHRREESPRLVLVPGT
jgi:hypothetical protein